MIVAIIAAMAENRVIGRAGAIPWDIPADRRRFRELTLGHPVIMGRRTFESIGRPLPGRTNIILARQPEYQAAGCLVTPSLAEALAACAGAEEVFVCGGEKVYQEALPLASRIYLTIVHRNYAGDTFFPPIPSDFMVVEERDASREIPCTFVLYQRIGRAE